MIWSICRSVCVPSTAAQHPVQPTGTKLTLHSMVSAFGIVCFIALYLVKFQAAPTVSSADPAYLAPFSTLSARAKESGLQPCLHAIRPGTTPSRWRFPRWVSGKSGLKTG